MHVAISEMESNQCKFCIFHALKWLNCDQQCVFYIKKNNELFISWGKNIICSLKWVIIHACELQERSGISGQFNNSLNISSLRKSILLKLLNSNMFLTMVHLFTLLECNHKILLLQRILKTESALRLEFIKRLQNLISRLLELNKTGSAFPNI